MTNVDVEITQEAKEVSESTDLILKEAKNFQDFFSVRFRSFC